MMSWMGLTWGMSEALWALALLPVAVLLFLWAERRRRELLQKLVAARLQSTLAGSLSVAKRRMHFALVLAGLALLVAALAKPRYGYTFEEAKRKGRDVLIAIDTSRSMLSTDVAPSRLARAKLAAQDLINALEGDRAGLIAFAGSAFLQAPLTVDYSAVLSSLNELDTNIIPLGGTNIAEAINTAVEAFGKGESESRCLVLFTDGEELDADALAAARNAAKTTRMKIFTVGVGSGDGSLIPVPGENGGTEFVKDAKGNFVKSRLDEAKLKEIAAATGGFYVHLQNGPSEMHRIVDEGLGGMKEQQIDERMSRKPIERYQWPLGAGLALLVLSVFVNERRRSRPQPASPGRKRARAVVTLLGIAACLPLNHARAASAPTGLELYAQKHYDEARKQFEAELQRRPDSPALQFNKGTADYGLGKDDIAIDEFSKALAASDTPLRSKAEYNLGTALLRRALKRDEQKEDELRKADLKNAIQHLDEALKLDPKQTDAGINKKIATQELNKPKPTPPPSNKDQKKDDKDKKDQDKKDQQSKDQQSKDQQSKDQQSKDQQSKDQQSKDQQSKDQQSKDQQSKDQQSKDQQSKGQQGKDQQPPDNQNSGSQDQQNQQNQGRPSPTPAPAPTPDDKKLSGDIKAQNSPEKPKDPSKEEAEAGMDTPEKPGEMSPNQAKAVLDSLKGEDDQPFKNEQRSAAPVLKDW